MKKILDYKGDVVKGKLFKDVAEEWQERHFKTIEYNTRKSYTAPYDRAIEEFGETYIKQIKPNQLSSFIGQFVRKGYAQKTVKKSTPCAKPYF